MEGKCQAAFSCHLWAPAKATVIVGNAFSTGVESSKLCRFIGFHGKRGLLWNSLLCSFTFSSQNFCCWYHTLWNWGPFCFLFFCFYSSRSFFLRWIFFFFFFSLSLQNLKGFFLSTGISTVNIFLPAVIRLPLQPINPGHVLFVDQFWFERMLFASEFKIWFPTTKP